MQTDVYIQQDVRLGRGTRLSVGISVSNLFNQDTATSKFVVETEPGAGLTFDEADLYAGRLDFQQLFAAARAQGPSLPDDERLLGSADGSGHGEVELLDGTG